MPRDFDGSTGYLSNHPGGGAALSAYPCSICAWIKPNVNNAEKGIAGVAKSDTGTPFIRLRMTSGGKASAQSRSDASQAATADGTTTLSVGTEYCVVGTWAANGTPKLYLFTGGAGGLETTGSAPAGTTITCNQTQIGALRSTGASQFWDGLVGHVAFWDVELNSTQAGQLGAGALPDTVGSPVDYWTVDTNTSPELDEIEAMSLTLTGTAPRVTPDFTMSFGSPQAPRSMQLYRHRRK
jgi:hypothetical protein